MLNRKSQGLDLQEVRLADQAVEIDTQGMSSEFGVEASTQAPEGMRMIDFNLELAGELGIHGFNHLADRVVETVYVAWQLFVLILSRDRGELDAVVLPQVSSFFGTDISFITQDL